MRKEVFSSHEVCKDRRTKACSTNRCCPDRGSCLHPFQCGPRVRRNNASSLEMGAQSSTIRGEESQQPAEQQELEERDGRGRTALLRAVDEGDEAGARRLVECGASVRAVDDAGRTALMAAARAGAAWLCAMLMDAGADVAATDLLGQTALHAAAMEGAGEDGPVVVELLLQCGAEPHVQDGCGRTALHYALGASDLEAAEVLVSAVGPLPTRDDTGRTELHWAAADGTPEMVWQLMTHFGDGVSERDLMGMTPLARALQALNRATARVLVEKVRPGDPADEVDAFGRTELHWAAYAGYPEVVRQLLRCGFSPWVVDHCGKDALHWAVESGDRLVVEEILDEEGYRECADNRGRTALHVAAIRGDAAVTAILMARGADPSLEDSSGYTPLTYALIDSHRDAAFVLTKRGTKSVRRRDRQNRMPLHWAAVGGDVACVRELLARGALINAVDSQRKTATALAVEHGHEQVAIALVRARGFRVMHDLGGRTPLHGAAAAGMTELAMELLERGADPYEGDCENLSPVALALNAGHHQLANTISRYWRL